MSFHLCLNGEGIDLGCDNPVEIIHPKVIFEGDTVFVECCYWNDLRGLVKETSSVRFEGSRVTEVKRRRSTTIYENECGIMF